MLKRRHRWNAGYGLSDLPCFSTWSVCARSARRRRVSLSWWRTDVPRCPTTKHDGRGPTPADGTLSPILGRVSSIEYMFILISHDKAGRTVTRSSVWKRTLASSRGTSVPRSPGERRESREKTRRRDPRRDTTRADHGSTRDSGGTVSAAGAAATKHDEARQEKTERGKVGAEMRREGRREIQQVRVRCLLD